LSSITLSLIKIKVIHQCEDTDRVYVIFRTSPWATHMVCAGDLVPAGTTLVTPELAYMPSCIRPEVRLAPDQRILCSDFSEKMHCG